MMIDYHANLAINEAITGKLGLDLKLIPVGDKNQCPRTEGTTIWVPTPQITWTKAQWYAYLDSNFHECGHNMDECNDVWDFVNTEKIDMNSIAGFTLNIVDDHRNDNRRTRKYRGMMVYHSESMPRKYSEILAKDFPSRGVSPMMDIVGPVAAMDAAARATWNKGVEGYSEQFINKLDAIGVEQAEILLRDYFDRYLSLNSAAEEWQFTKDILENVFNLPTEEQKEKPDEPSEKGKNEEDGEPADADSEDSGEDGSSSIDTDGDDDSSGYGSESSEDSGEEGESQKREREVQVITYKDFLESDHTKHGKTPGGVDIDYSDMPEGSVVYEPHTAQSTITITYQNGDKFSPKDTTRPISSDVIDEFCDRLHISTITNKLRTLLQIQTQKRTRLNQKKGKLHANSLHRVLGADKERASRVFKSTSSKLDLDCAVSVLIDCSGSMYRSSKIEIACASAVAVSSVLSALHVNHEVLGFTEMSDGYRKAGRDNILHVFKEFNRPVTATNLREHMSQATKALKNNADGDSILHAYHRLIKQKNQRKVLIVLSDGQPACHGGDIGNFTKQVIQQIEQKSPVDIIGLGILDRSASLFYTNHRTVRDIEELPQCLISTLKDMIA